MADEDLYDLFVDYFERPDGTTGLRRRRRRSILGGFSRQHPIQAEFPQAERVGNKIQQQQHLKTTSDLVFGPPGAPADPAVGGGGGGGGDPDNVLTHEDIRDVTRQSDLGQILQWLEALSQV